MKIPTLVYQLAPTPEVAQEIMAACILQWPNFKWNCADRPEGIDMRTLAKTLVKLGKPTDPLSADYSASGWSIKVDTLICANCGNIKQLDSPIFDHQAGFLTCCPDCAIDPKDFYLTHAVTSIWLPSELSMFPRDYQLAVRERAIDRTTRIRI